MNCVNKTFREVTGFDDRWVIFVGYPITSVLSSLLLFNDQFESMNLPFMSICIPMSFLYTGVFWIGIRQSYKYVRCRFPGSHEIGKRLMGLGVGFLVIYFFVDLVLDPVLSRLIPHDAGGSPSVLMVFISSLLLTALVVSIYESLSFYLQLQKAMEEKTELARQNVESQLEGLRNQVNPHFLFNSLNTLIYLIPEEPEKAVRFVQQLSKVYRYILESREARLIPLREELDFLKAYVFLQKERFGENLHVVLPENGHLPDAAVVPLTLQMLFENAIKHNVISTEKPLKIEVFSENGHLVVRNNLQRKNQVMDSTGVGLQNIKDRYRILSRLGVEVIASQQYFTVVLPILSLEKTGAPDRVF